MTKKIKLFHIFATFVPGGVQVRMSTIINSLPEHFHHTIMAMDQRLDARSLIKDKVSVNCILPVGEKNSSFFTILKLARIIHSLDPDIILTYNWGALNAILAAKICHFKKIIHMEAGFRPDEAEGPQKKRRILIRHFLFRHVSGVIVPSVNLKGIAENIWRIPRNKIFYISNGVDCNRFSPGKVREARQGLGIEDEACVIGTVAHLREEKNLKLLMRSFAGIEAEIPPHLLIIGDGPEKEFLVNLALTIGIKDRVHFLGHYKDPSQCYQMMDIFALSSKTEQMPVSILEAMASGLPVLSTDVGDIRNIVEDENQSFIVPRDNESRYQEALAQLITSEEKRKCLGLKNRQKCVRKYRHDQMIAAYYNLYKEVLYSSS